MKVEERNKKIIEEYLSGKVFTQAIAKKYRLTSRQVQRIVKEAGVSKTLAERNREVAPFKSYSEFLLPPIIKEYRKYLSQDTRQMYLSANPQCEECKILRGHGVRMEVTFRNPKNFDSVVTNLKTLCRKCLQKDPAFKFIAKSK